MSGTVTAFADKVPDGCQAVRCDKDGCRVDLAGAPPVRVIVDMDCGALPIPDNWKRCDYLFVGEERNVTWVAPIELKSGRLSADTVLEQLEGGALAADAWLPEGVSFELAPVLAHGKKIHRNDLKVLRSRKIQLRGHKERNCVDKMRRSIDPGATTMIAPPARSRKKLIEVRPAARRDQRRVDVGKVAPARPSQHPAPVVGVVPQALGDANDRLPAESVLIFIGPSNTGKLYLAILLYVIHQCFGGSDPSHF